MNSQEIEVFLEKVIQGKFHFDIISENEACGKIKINNKPMFLIVNTEPSWLPGEHWLVFYFPKDDVPEFFDSFGHEPSYYSYHFTDFLCENSKQKNFWVNSQQLQTFGSNICGLYCILFVLSRISNISFENFIANFSQNKQENDCKCVKRVEEYFHVCFKKE